MVCNDVWSSELGSEPHGMLHHLCVSLCVCGGGDSRLWCGSCNGIQCLYLCVCVLIVVCVPVLGLCVFMCVTVLCVRVVCVHVFVCHSVVCKGCVCACVCVSQCCV